jgi:isoquinoline 1-oxidoreductase beta subunit
MSIVYRVTRRDFLRDAGVAAGALVFGSYLLPENLLGKDIKADLGKLKEILHNHLTLNSFVAIQPLDGTIVIVTHRPEMGQGIRSSLAAVLADELEADWSRVKLHQADCDSLAYAIEFPYKIPADTKLAYPFNVAPFTEPPTDKPMYSIGPEGSQFADSSRSMTAYFQVMRLTGAGIKLVFLRAAALKFGVSDMTQLRAQQHKIYHDASGRSVEYHHLLLEAGKVALPRPDEAEDALKKNPSEWRFIGKEGMPFVDAPNMVMGKVEYGADIKVPGMLTAMVERCPVANGLLVSFDDTAALAVPGVRKVTAVLPSGLAPGGVGRAFVPHAGVAVLADNTWAALQGRRALHGHIKWDYPKDNDHSGYDSLAFRDELEKSTNAEGDVVRKKGDAISAIASAAKQVKADYYVPLLAQAPMEPPMAIALLKNDKLEVWAPTQNPDAAQQMAGRLAFGIPETEWAKEDSVVRMRRDVTLHMPLVGGGFGRKSKPDYIGEAALLAAQNPGVPIRVQWTREDDIQFSYYNAVSSQHLEAGLDADGHPTGLLLRSAFTSFLATIFPPSQAEARAAFFDSGRDKYGSGIERAQGLEDMPFDLPNIQIENCPATNHIRTGWMRSVANIYHAFGICSFASELAVAAGRDCKDYLLELIGKGRDLTPVLKSELTGIQSLKGVKQYRNNELPLEIISVPIEGGKIRQVVPGFPPNTTRLIEVVKRVAEESGWDEKVKRYKGMKGRGIGIAAHRSFLSYAAIVADITLTDSDDPNGAKELKVNEIWGVIDCGLAVNPDRVRAQMEGGINYGLSYGLLGEITVKDGAVEQHNFDDYPVLRMHQAPKINVHIMKSDQPPSGVGEPPTPAVAPAVANAIFFAGGPRIREIPFAAKKEDDKTKVIVR